MQGLLVQNFIPLIQSETRLCLTAANWKEAKVTTISYSLEFLLYKPGEERLKKITDLKHYLGWSGILILNAASLVANQEGIYTLKSPYDGSKIQKTPLELLALIQHLKPDAAILPKNILLDYLNGKITLEAPFFHVDDLRNQKLMHPYGVYFPLNDEAAFVQLHEWEHIPRYVMGSIDYHLICSLRAKGITLIESDEPISAALQGRVYSQSDEIDLTSESARLAFEPIDSECNCPTCSQHFTQAYFHYLMHHTPLLCQRLLIQHNVFWLANKP
jgi:queuine tRNA-ribosyltransferase